MAITPRTVISDPINLLMFALGLLALGGLAGVFVGASDSEQPCTTRAAQAPPDASPSLDAGADRPKDGAPVGLSAVGAAADDPEHLDHTCRLEQPSPAWTEGQWLRHLDCMAARGEEPDALLVEVDDAIAHIGLTPELAAEKAEVLEQADRPDEHIRFLDAAVTRLGVSEGELVHELTRALTWRGEEGDIERIRHLQLLSRMLLPDSCEVLQTDVWVRYSLAERLAEGDSPAALDGVERAIHAYLANDCHARIEHRRAELIDREVLAEVTGVGVVAEAINGHSGHSSLVRKAAASGALGNPVEFCHQAVPAEVGLRDDCAKRVGDEVFLAQ